MKPEDVISCFCVPFLAEPDHFAVAITMEPVLSQLNSFTNDPSLYSFDLDPIQLLPDTQLNFKSVQLFPDIQLNLLHQAPLCDPDQFLVPGFSLPPLPTFPDYLKQTPSNLLLFNQDYIEKTSEGQPSE